MTDTNHPYIESPEYVFAHSARVGRPSPCACAYAAYIARKTFNDQINNYQGRVRMHWLAQHAETQVIRASAAQYMKRNLREIRERKSAVYADGT